MIRSSESSEPSTIKFQPYETLFNEQFPCTLINFVGSKVEVGGKLIVTDYRCVFLDTQPRIHFSIPLGFIQRSESSTEQVNKNIVFSLELFTKFQLALKVKSSNFSLTKANQYINKMINNECLYAEKLGAFKNKDQKSNCTCWSLTDDQPLPESELYDNKKWLYLPLYPECFRVPKPFIGKRSTTERMIVLSFALGEKKKVGLWRSGPGKPDPLEDEWIPKAARSKDHYVIDIRNRSLGSQKSHASKCFQMDTPSQLRENFSKLYSATFFQSDQQKWMNNLNSSRWFQQVQVLLQEAQFVMEKIIHEINVTIVAEWDIRCSQITGLAQILCRPENRTFEGFSQLMEKQFLHYGNYVGPNSKRQKHEDKGIAIIQFLDCVFQLLSIYPLSFEFTEDYLTFIATHIYSKKYGNFLYATKCIIENQRRKPEKLQSIWFDILERKKQFINPFYVDRSKCEIFQLRKQIPVKGFRIWGSLYCRNILNCNQKYECNQIRNQYRKICIRHHQTQIETENLRKSITNQHKIILELKKQLKELKSDDLM